ncbi:hypothetical protein T07_2003, partial [Trichinella nelsoni]
MERKIRPSSHLISSHLIIIYNSISLVKRFFSNKEDSILCRLMHLAEVSYQLYGLQSLKFGYGSFEKILSQNI